MIMSCTTTTALPSFLFVLLFILLLKVHTGWSIWRCDIVVASDTNRVEEYNNHNNNFSISHDTRSDVSSSSWRWRSSRRMLYDWWKKPKCSDRDIGISQSRETTSGVPQFIVEIYTTCMNDCEPSDVHLKCEWFASTAVVNPRIFRRLAFNDCLVNGGRPIPRGQILRFAYENSFMYSLSFKSAKFC